MSREPGNVIEYRNYALPAEFPILLLAGKNWRISSIKASRLHFHNCLEIGCCHSGSGLLSFETHDEAFRGGDITCISKNVPHTTCSTPGDESLWSYLFLDPMEMLKDYMGGKSMFLDMLSSCHLVLPASRYPAVGQLVTQIIDELALKRPNYRVCVHSLCAALMVLFLRVYEESRCSGEYRQESVIPIAPALDYISLHYREDFAIENLAQMCHLSPTHFRRKFHELMGMPPLAYVHQLRIVESCALLRMSNRSIAGIAEQVGYVSVNSFNRRFRQMMEVSPLQWRRQHTDTAPHIVLEYSGWLAAEKEPKN